jgi:hypothetical protein
VGARCGAPPAGGGHGATRRAADLSCLRASCRAAKRPARRWRTAAPPLRAAAAAGGLKPPGPSFQTGGAPATAPAPRCAAPGPAAHAAPPPPVAAAARSAAAGRPTRAAAGARLHAAGPHCGRAAPARRLPDAEAPRPGGLHRGYRQPEGAVKERPGRPRVPPGGVGRPHNPGPPARAAGARASGVRARRPVRAPQ